MSTVCTVFKVSFTQVLPMFVSCIWNTQGQVGRQSDITLTAICSLGTFFQLSLCLILLFCFFVSHVQFCKAKSRCNLSQVFSLQRSLTVSCALTYNTPLLSSPYLLNALILSLFPLCLFIHSSPHWFWGWSQHHFLVVNKCFHTDSN